MKISTGVDLIEIIRIEGAVDRFGLKFLKRIFTKKELSQFMDNLESLAVRFAAKEAVSKALGCGIGEVGWQEIEVLRDDKDTPVLFLHGRAFQRADQLGFHDWSISLSHTAKYAVAFVVVIGD